MWRTLEYARVWPRKDLASPHPAFKWVLRNKRRSLYLIKQALWLTLFHSSLSFVLAEFCRQSCNEWNKRLNSENVRVPVYEMVYKQPKCLCYVVLQKWLPQHDLYQCSSVKSLPLLIPRSCQICDLFWPVDLCRNDAVELASLDLKNLTLWFWVFIALSLSI